MNQQNKETLKLSIPLMIMIPSIIFGLWFIYQLNPYVVYGVIIIGIISLVLCLHLFSVFDRKKSDDIPPRREARV